MSFVSFEFMMFATVCFLLCSLMQGTVKKILLCFANMIFVLSFGNVFHALWISGVSIVSYFLCRMIVYKGSKGCLWCAVSVLVLTLCFFKYYPVLGFENVLVPIGISFTTFKIIGTFVQLYHKKMELCSFLDYFVYVSFFPALTAGPIHRADQFVEQLNQKAEWNYLRYKNAFIQMMMGMFQKIVFADYLAIVCANIFGNEEIHGVLLAAGVVLYSFQIYLDFDGYSNIAIGLAKLLGFEMERNFHTPYVSSSIMEFWDRWHISLSTWLKNYIYIPLGGNRKGTLRKYLNVLVVFLVSGLWHGSTLVFLVWGIGHGLVNIIENMIASVVKIKPGFVLKTLLTFVNFGIVTFLWIFFRSADFNEAFSILQRLMILNRASLDYTLAGLTLREVVWIGMIVFVTISTDLMRNKINMIEWLSQRHVVVRWSIYAGLILIVMIFGVYGPGHAASDFIYASF